MSILIDDVTNRNLLCIQINGRNYDVTQQKLNEETRKRDANESILSLLLGAEM
jgi:hypothetical protein